MATSKHVYSPHQYLNPWLFVSQFDKLHWGKPLVNQRYSDGLMLGRRHPEVHINAEGTWSGYDASGPQIHSGQAIGYHACTMNILQGFLASAAIMIVHRPGEGFENGTIIKPPEVSVTTTGPSQFQVQQGDDVQHYDTDIGLYHALLHGVKQWSSTQRGEATWLYTLGGSFNSKVHNTRNGKAQSYKLPPREAVISAWEQEHGNLATWEYPSKGAIAELRETQAFVFCGNWKCRKV